MSAEKTLFRDTFLPFSRPAIGDAEIAELVDSLRSGRIVQPFDFLAVAVRAED